DLCKGVTRFGCLEGAHRCGAVCRALGDELAEIGGRGQPRRLERGRHRRDTCLATPAEHLVPAVPIAQEPAHATAPSASCASTRPTPSASAQMVCPAV